MLKMKINKKKKQKIQNFELKRFTAQNMWKWSEEK